MIIGIITAWNRQLEDRRAKPQSVGGARLKGGGLDDGRNVFRAG